jgi:proteasome assembly chaperone (PAC2) family protein
MTHLNFNDETPELRDPVLIAAFAGWSDAGGAASAASQYLVERWRAAPLAKIDAQDFYDFTQLRPTSRWVGDVRHIDWPENAFHYYKTEERDLIIFNGIEPHLQWKAYLDAFTEVITRFQVKLVITLGAMFVEYPHTRPMRITGNAPDPEMAARAGLRPRGGGGRYQGPTGISGVLGVSLRDLDVPAATVWANVPHYVSAAPNPPATLALLKAVTSMLEVEVPMGRMVRASTAFETQLTEATSKNPEVSEYVRTLEERVDAEQATTELPAELPPTENLLEDIEAFLRRSSREES